MKYEVEIQGVTPILMNRFKEDAEVAVSSGHSPAHNAGDRGTPRDEAEVGAYRDDDGYLYIPHTWIFSSLINAGKFHKIGRNKMTTAKSSLVPAYISVDELMIDLFDEEGNKITEFEVDSRSVRIPATGGRIMRHRARIDAWKAKFTLEVDPQGVSENLMRTLVDDAGKKIGIGDFRPETRGAFGKFVVSNWAREAA